VGGPKQRGVFRRRLALLSWALFVLGMGVRGPPMLFCFAFAWLSVLILVVFGFFKGLKRRHALEPFSLLRSCPSTFLHAYKTYAKPIKTCIKLILFLTTQAIILRLSPNSGMKRIGFQLRGRGGWIPVNGWRGLGPHYDVKPFKTHVKPIKPTQNRLKNPQKPFLKPTSAKPTKTYIKLTKRWRGVVRSFCAISPP